MLQFQWFPAFVMLFCLFSSTFILIHSANPKSRPIGIIVFAHVVRPYPLFKSRKTKRQKTMLATGVTMGLAEWIIDDTYLVYIIFFVSGFHGPLVWTTQSSCISGIARERSSMTLLTTHSSNGQFCYSSLLQGQYLPILFLRVAK